MVILINELEDMKTESLLKDELRFKMSSREKKQGYRTKKSTLLFIWKEKRRKKSQVLHRLGCLSRCGKGAECYYSHFAEGQWNSQWTDRTLHKGKWSETKGRFSSLPITIRRNTLFTCPLL